LELQNKARKTIKTGHSQIINVNFLQKKDDTWEEVTIYFKDFQEIVIGEPTGNMMKSKSLKNIVRMGIMTYEKKEGPFSLEVDYIEFIK